MVLATRAVTVVAVDGCRPYCEEMPLPQRGWTIETMSQMPLSTVEYTERVKMVKESQLVRFSRMSLRERQ